MVPISDARISSYTVPTHGLESDSTLEWSSTTIVIAEVQAGQKLGLGYTYGHRAIAPLITDVLVPLIRGRNAMDVAGPGSQ